MLRKWIAAPHSGALEIGTLAALYALYEVVRGFGGLNYPAAFAHTADIVRLEQGLGIFWERGIQDAAEAIPFVPMVLGLLYVVLHFGGTAAALVWIHRRHRHAFPVVRTALVVSTALAVVGYVLYPAAPPRLSNLGFADTVSSQTGLNLSSDLLGSLYNPIAAVPSLHFGYALLVGMALAHIGFSRVVASAYPALMLLIIVATGNHFFVDAIAGGAVTVAGWVVAKRVANSAVSRTPAHRSPAFNRVALAATLKVLVP